MAQRPKQLTEKMIMDKAIAMMRQLCAQPKLLVGKVRTLDDDSSMDSPSMLWTSSSLYRVRRTGTPCPPQPYAAQ